MNSPAEYLRGKGISYRELQRPAGPQLVMECPFCSGGQKREKETFAINALTGAWNCTRKNHCGRSGSFYALREHFGDAAEGPKVRPVGFKKEYHRPDPSMLTGLAPAALKYLTEERKLSVETLQAWDVHSKKGDRENIAFVYRKSGRHLNTKYRYHGGGKTPWKAFQQERDAEPCLYGHDMVPLEAEDLILVEGEVDALTLWQVGFKNVVSVPNGTDDLNWVEHEWEWLRRFKTILIAMDMDEAGQKAAAKLAHRIESWRCSIVGWPEKDPNKMLQVGHTVERFHQAIIGARELKPEILVSADTFEEEITEAMERPERERDGAVSEFPFLNSLLRGFRRGEMTVWTGRNGSGKSTLTLQLANYFAVYNKARVCVGSFEMIPASYLEWMLLQALHEKAHDAASRKELFRIWGSSLYLVNCYGSINLDVLIEAMTYAAKRYGVWQFFVDSLMKIKTPIRDKLDHQIEVVQTLKDFAQKERVHVHLVAHPRKPGQGGRDDSEPDKVDVRGASEITDLADNSIILNRPDESRATMGKQYTTLRLKKNRKYGSEGFGSLEFYPTYKLFAQSGKPCPDWFDLDGTP